jgi:hypothetical protein
MVLKRPAHSVPACEKLQFFANPHRVAIAHLFMLFARVKIYAFEVSASFTETYLE